MTHTLYDSFVSCTFFCCKGDIRSAKLAQYLIFSQTMLCRRLSTTKTKQRVSFYTQEPSIFFFSTWDFQRLNVKTNNQFRQGTLAFGPQHPAAHGILRVQMQLSGEVLHWIDPQFGFLHRGTEKLMEGRNVLQSLPYFDRFDYVANLFQEHAFCLTVESLSKAPTLLTASTQLFRILFDEVSRLLNHLLTLSATALDLSVMGPIFWAFEEREALMEICERASGARMHTALYKPFTFDVTAVTPVLLQDLTTFLSRCSRSLSGAFLGLLNNRSFKSRLSTIGQIGQARLASYGISGLLARSGGELFDLRVQARQGYGLYRTLALRIFLGKRGDNLDRFLIRVKETVEGFRLLTQIIQRFNLTSSIFFKKQKSSHLVSLVYCWTNEVEYVKYGSELFGTVDYLFLKKKRIPSLSRSTLNATSIRHTSTLSILDLEPWNLRGKFSSMETLITHFRQATEGWPLNAGFSYCAVESPKGEVGVAVVSTGALKPIRVKLRTPVSHNMHLLPTISLGATFADFVASFCSFDIVMGEIDR